MIVMIFNCFQFITKMANSIEYNYICETLPCCISSSENPFFNQSISCVNSLTELVMWHALTWVIICTYYAILPQHKKHTLTKNVKPNCQNLVLYIEFKYNGCENILQFSIFLSQKVWNHLDVRAIGHSLEIFKFNFVFVNL